MQTLLNTLPQTGRLQWIGVRPARGEPMLALQHVDAQPGRGLVGDRFRGRPGSKRQVTLIQAEHFQALSALLPECSIQPELLRRNLMVSGINLLALKDQQFTIGEVLFEGTTVCAPCSKMEATLGPGGYNAMRGHGGICARVLRGGKLRLGEPVSLYLEHA